MTSSLTKEERIRLIGAVRGCSPKLADWLEARPGLVMNKQLVNYGAKVLEAGHGKEPPPVGIVMRGVVEVQGDVQGLAVSGENVTFPLALRAEGETIGEVEHSAFRLHNGLWKRPWSTYAGMQTFYFTPLRSTKNSPFGQAKTALSSRAERYQAVIAWIKSKDIDAEGDAILHEISLTRLLTITSIWSPDESDLREMFDTATAEEPGLSITNSLGVKHRSLTRKGILLYREVIAAMQGARLTFRPFSEKEMMRATPWDSKLLVKWTKAPSPRYEDFLFLGIHSHEMSGSDPFVVLPHFYCQSSNRADRASKVSISGQFKSDLIHVAILANGYSRVLKKRAGSQGTPLGVREHEVVAIVTNTDMQKDVHSSAGDTKTHVIQRLGKDLKIEGLKLMKDLDKLGFLGTAALVVFSEKALMARLHHTFEQLLKRTRAQITARSCNPLVCGLQHVLPSQEHLFNAIQQSGISDDAPVIIGKLYSTVQSSLPPENYLLHEPAEISFRRGAFERAFKSTLRSFCRRRGLTAAHRPPQKVAIMDDGGYVSAFLSDYFIKGGGKVVVIEQTTSGLRRSGQLRCPVINVAGGLLKREVESLFVAECGLRALERRGVFCQGARCWGVIGFGAVGAATCRYLRRQRVGQILVYERHLARRNAATQEGFAIVETPSQIVAEADVILGCTGSDFAMSAMPESIVRRKPELVCASLGSSDIEFAHWISQAGIARIGRESGRPCGNAFDDVRGKFGVGRYRVVNGGFPVNLDRSVQCDPEPDFILTRMLMFAGLIQALPLLDEDSNAAGGIVSIDSVLERTIFDIWCKAYPSRLPIETRRRLISQLDASV